MASTKLTRTQTAGTNRKKFTLSMWVKKTIPKGVSNVMTGLWCTEGGWYDGTGMAVVFRDDDGSNILTIYNPSEGGTGGNYNSTTQAFRDINGWYHFVFAGDTTQSTQADRLKIYVNGEQISYTTNNLPAQDVFWNDLNSNNKTFTIGAGSGSGHYYHDGIMSHVHMSDGYVYDASTFGSTDATTGEWKLNSSPSFTLGNNGFTILKDGNTVTDQSTNSNNFTLSGTLTKTEDCPDNVFCTANALSKGSDTVLTNGNNTARNDTSSNSNTLGTIAFGNGKYYFEGYRHGGGNIGIGVCLASAEGTTHSSVEAGRVLYYENGSIFCNGLSDQSNITTGVTYSDTDIISVSMDTENGILKFYKNDTLVTNSTITNSKFTNAENIWVPHTYQNNGGEWRLNFGNGYFGTTAVSSAGTNASNNGIFEYDVKPSDATALSTKGLNL